MCAPPRGGADKSLRRRRIVTLQIASRLFGAYRTLVRRAVLYDERNEWDVYVVLFVVASYDVRT